MNNFEILDISKTNGLKEFFDVMVKNGKLSLQDSHDYKTGKKELYTGDLYLRKYIGTSLTNVIEVINENDSEYINRCNFYKGAVPPGVNLIMSHLELSFGISTDPNEITTPEVVEYSNAMFNIADLSNFPDPGDPAGAIGAVPEQRIIHGLTTGEYEFNCNRELIDKGRIKELLIRGTTSFNNQGQGENKRALYWPKLLPSGKILDFKLKYPSNGYEFSPDSGGSPPYFFVEIAFKGLKLDQLHYKIN